MPLHFHCRKTNPPAYGVYINGIFIEGAAWNWNKSILEEQRPRVLFESMPAIHLMAGFTSE